MNRFGGLGSEKEETGDGRVKLSYIKVGKKRISTLHLYVSMYQEVAISIHMCPNWELGHMVQQPSPEVQRVLNYVVLNMDGGAQKLSSPFIH